MPRARLLVLLPVLLCGLPAGAAGQKGTLPMKSQGVFFGAPMMATAQANVARYPWARELQQQVVAAASPWLGYSDDQLWDLMFGNTIKRSWMVWSNGYCPACRQDVPMYNWEMDALARPWKVRCPHCQELFPKNDFHRFYRSGLDEHGVFDPARADRSLLFNADHPDPADPLHSFGVDDGEGYVEGEHRWRFIGAYLIYGQWKQAIVAGICRLAAAYAVTGDPTYAHRAGVLLGRVADLYPTMDFGKEGVMYEGPPRSGYVSTWHDACAEVRSLALAYDQVFPALQADQPLADFLAAKASQYRLPAPQGTPGDVVRNIEERIFQDTLANRPKIESNYPQTDITLAIIRTVLGWPQNREEIYGTCDAILEKATAVDGVTGEKGLAGYASYALYGTSWFLELYGRMDPGFLPDMLRRHPRLHDMYRFHIDTWCLGKYYPTCGDSGGFGTQVTQYAGVGFSAHPGLEPSMFSFVWRLAELTGDANLVQALYGANGGSVADLPHDLFAPDPEAVQRGVGEMIARHGPTPRLGSVNKEQWHLAILRSGEGEAARALWLDYDAGGAHGHQDGLNLGLYAYGLDLLPDFGYPPVNYGGWGAPRSVWYTMSAAHNTVVVDGRSSRSGAGRHTLWAEGDRFHAVRASAPALIEGQQFERTAALVDVSGEHCYVLDVFRVVGGSDHAKLTHSHFASLSTQGLSLAPAADYGHDTQMRSFRVDPAPAPGWSADWKVEDRRGYLPPGTDLHLRCFDLSQDAQAGTAEAWISVSGHSGSEEAWIPLVMARRQGPAPLASTFVGVLEPYLGTSQVRLVRRLPLEGAGTLPGDVAVEVQLADGRRDLLLAADAEPRAGRLPVLSQRRWGVRAEAELVLVRLDPQGRPERLALCHGRRLRVGALELSLPTPADYLELVLTPQPHLAAGSLPPGSQLLDRGHRLPVP